MTLQAGGSAPARGPDVVVVMGVSGVGKSTIGQALATTLGWAFAEGDAFHSAAAVAMMHAGVPLTDGDRWPWLDRIGAWITAELAAGQSAVVTCSALRRVYLDRLRAGRPAVRFLDLVAPEVVVADRVRRRVQHFMPASLVDSQYVVLEPLEPEETAAGSVVVPVDGPPELVLRRSLAALGLEPCAS